MKNVSVEVVDKAETHTLCSITFVFENHAIYRIMGKNIVERGRPQMATGAAHCMTDTEGYKYTQHFNFQLMHTTLKNVELLKHFKISKNAPTCFGLRGNHHQGATIST